MSERRCRTCRWWLETGGFSEGVAALGILEEAESSRWGECRLNPPSYETGMWPPTDETDWCGQWARGEAGDD